jgi:general secretion pathway protein C
MNILYFLLPKKNILYTNNAQNELEYKRYDINNLFKEIKNEVVINNKITKKQEYQILSNIKLLAIYAMSDNSGYIIIQENSKQDTIILLNNEKFKNYVLTKIYKYYVIFTKNNKEYKLSLEDEKHEARFDVVTNKKNIKIINSISIDNNQVTIKRELINDYIKNFDKIWNDISIKDVRGANGLDGFRVVRIKKNTPFANIGLKKNDIITSINNIELKSYNDAFKIYKKINKIKSLNIKVLRDDIETEIYYEIK